MLLLEHLTELIVEAHVVLLEATNILSASLHLYSHLLRLGQRFTLTSLCIRQHRLLVHETLPLAFVLPLTSLILSMQALQRSLIFTLHLC